MRYTKEEIEKAMGDSIFRAHYGKDWDRVKEATRFQNNRYGFEEPAEIHGWEWSTDFGRWSALVTFKDGTRTFTWPERDSERPQRKTLAEWREENPGVHVEPAAGNFRVFREPSAPDLFHLADFSVLSVCGAFHLMGPRSAAQMEEAERQPWMNINCL